VNTDEDVKIDDRHRAALGDRVKPKERYAVETPNDGVIVLRRMVISQAKLPKVKLERRKGRTLLVSNRTVTQADVQRVLEAFP
jgi:hypothetical protein